MPVKFRHLIYANVFDSCLCWYFIAIFLLAMLSTSQSIAQLYEGPTSPTAYQQGNGAPVWPVATFGSGAGRSNTFSNGENNSYRNSISGELMPGEYTITNTTAQLAPSGIHITKDHTGNQDGRMIVTNGLSDKNIVYQNTATLICTGRGFELSAWFMNLSTVPGADVSVTINAYTVIGTLIKSYTATIKQTSQPIWTHIGTTFIAPQENIVLQIVNSIPATSLPNLLAIDDVSFRDCSSAISSSINGVEGVKEVSNCTGDGPATFLLEAKLYPLYQNAIYQWQVYYNNLPAVTIAGASSPNLLVDNVNKPTGTYRYILVINPNIKFNGAGSPYIYCQTGGGTFVINFKSPPKITAGNNGPLCPGQPLNLNAEGGNTYHWRGPKNFESNSPSVQIPSVDETNAGIYTVTVDEAEGNCSSSTSTVVQVKTLPLTVSPDVTICAGNSTQLAALQVPGYTYRWFPSTGLSDATIAAPIATPDVTTTYMVQAVSAAYPCPSFKNIVVTVLPKLIVKAGADKTILAGKPTILAGAITGNNYTFKWSPPDYLDDAFRLNPIATPPKDMVYTLNAFYNNECSPQSDEVSVKVLPYLTIPNTFSPNADGVNDNWNIIGLNSNYPRSVVTVYNRNGSEVFKSVGYQEAWNGRFQNKSLPGGAYYYLIDLNNGSQPIKGSLMIVR